MQTTNAVLFLVTQIDVPKLPVVHGAPFWIPPACNTLLVKMFYVPVITALRVLRLRMEETAYIFGW